MITLQLKCVLLLAAKAQLESEQQEVTIVVSKHRDQQFYEAAIDPNNHGHYGLAPPLYFIRDMNDWPLRIEHSLDYWGPEKRTPILCAWV